MNTPQKNLLPFFVLVLVTYSCKKPPVACIEVEKLSVLKGDNMDFTACATDADTYRWDFGDGITAIGRTAGHIYEYEGSYDVQLVVESKAGKSTKTERVTVKEFEVLDIGTSSFDFIDAVFIAPSTVYASSDNHFHRSLDGGHTFTNTYFHQTLNAIHFLDADTGFAAALNGKVYKTVDAGENWNPLNNNSGNLYEMQFVTPQLGFAVGRDGTIIKIVDGKTTTKLNSGTTEFLYSVFFIDENTGFLSGENGLLKKTTDGGATWKSLNSPIANDLTALCFSSIDTGYLSSFKKIFKTTNGGNTWNQVYFNSTSPVIHKLYFKKNSQVGFAIGAECLILKTTDGGATWKQYTPLHGYRTLTGIDSYQNDYLIAGKFATLLHFR